MHRRTWLRIAMGGMATGIAGWPWLSSAETVQGRKPAVPGKVPPLRRIVLDPGHGGRDPGAIGVRGTQEKEVTLDLAKEIARQLARRRKAEIILTRETDEFLALRQRVEFARSAKADLFISLHADSAPSPKARGISAYTLSEKASDAFAQALARQENLADGLGVDLTHQDANVQAILLDLVARHTYTAALQVQRSLVEGLGRALPLLENPMRSANFAVLKAPDIPSVLIETGFLSNREDEQILRDAGRRKRIAGLIAQELGTLITAAPFT